MSRFSLQIGGSHGDGSHCGPLDLVRDAGWRARRGACDLRAERRQHDAVERGLPVALRPDVPIQRACQGRRTATAEAARQRARQAPATGSKNKAVFRP